MSAPKKRPEDHFSEMVVVRVTLSIRAYLDALMREGKYRSRAELVRSMLQCIADDDRRAHGEAA